MISVEEKLKWMFKLYDKVNTKKNFLKGYSHKQSGQLAEIIRDALKG
jgi:hypothetical protein